jgi:hypothetical protein
MKTFLIWCFMMVGLVAIDNKAGGIFPDRVYCDFGAGKLIVTPGSSTTRASGWSIGTQTIDNDGNIRRAPDRPNQYTTTHHPESSMCVHTTLWNGWTGENERIEERKRQEMLVKTREYEEIQRKRREEERLQEDANRARIERENQERARKMNEEYARQQRERQRGRLGPENIFR